MTWIKICGTTNLEDGLAAVNAGAEAVGFVFAAGPRLVTPEAAGEIADKLPSTVERVGVFQNETAERVQEIAEMVGLTTVQLHGDESPAFARQIAKLSRARSRNRARVRVIKAVSMEPGVEGDLREFAQMVDGLLLDSVVTRPAPGGGGMEVLRGGTGVSWDWKRAAQFIPGLSQYTRVILAGGLTPANVGEAVRTLRPWGVDVCSGVEAAPGKKDAAKIQSFVAAVRGAGS